MMAMLKEQGDLPSCLPTPPPAHALQGWRRSSPSTSCGARFRSPSCCTRSTFASYVSPSTHLVRPRSDTRCYDSAQNSAPNSPGRSCTCSAWRFPASTSLPPCPRIVPSPTCAATRRVFFVFSAPVHTRPLTPRPHAPPDSHRSLPHRLESRERLLTYNTIDDVVRLIHASRRILILTGAGISQSRSLVCPGGFVALTRDAPRRLMWDPRLSFAERPVRIATGERRVRPRRSTADVSAVRHHSPWPCTLIALSRFDIQYFRENPAGECCARRPLTAENAQLILLSMRSVLVSAREVCAVCILTLHGHAVHSQGPF